MAKFEFDTTKPAPGPWRMPNDSERRCRVYFKKAFRDCIDVCEVNPDLEECTDATMRIIAAAPDMLAALRLIDEWLATVAVEDIPPNIQEAMLNAINKATKG